MDSPLRGSSLLTCLVAVSLTFAAAAEAQPSSPAAQAARRALVAASSTANRPPRTALERLDAALARHEIDPVEADRERVFYLFDRRRMDARWRGGDDPPAKCGTALIDQLVRERSRLDPETRALLDAQLDVSAQGTASLVTTHFRIDYATTGPDAPVPTDVAPANGIPDFVEWTAAALEQAYATEVTQLGYTAPAIANGASARYPVTYQAQAAYGYTTVVSGQQTRMVLNPSYAGFPFNDDPEGNVVGDLRVTVAHELKHAIQRMYSPWTEGNWLELDATWIEDVVFDQVNDYLNFIRGSGSPFTAPEQSLIPGNAASYEDCNWETFQAATYGYDHLRAFWERRRVFPNEPVLTTWEQNFLSSGTDFTHAWGLYVAWNFASGEHAVPGFGYKEAATYPTTPATFRWESLPVAPISWPVNGSAASTQLISNASHTLSGTPEFTFVGAPGNLWQVSLLIRPRAGGLIDLPFALTSGQQTMQVPTIDWADVEWAAVVIGNPTPYNPAISYSFSARAIAPISIAHSPLWDRAEGPQPPVVKAVVAPGTSTLDPSSVSLTYRVTGGATSTTPMTPTGTPQEFAANLPNTVAGSTVEYRIEARSVAGDVVRSPSVPDAFHAFQVVSVFEPFESNGAWTVGDVDDDATTGVWERAAPVGTPAAPYFDATSPPGSACFLTQNGSIGGPLGEADVDGGKTTLRSPVFRFYPGPLARAEARYQRWYSNDIGARPDDVWRVDASNDGGASWVNVETATRGRTAWVPVTVDLKALFGTLDRVQFRFVAQDTGASSLVEAAVDDFEIVVVPANPVSVPHPEARPIALGSPWPNPSRARVRVTLTLPAGTPVWATVRDLEGRRVRTLLAAAPRPAGASWIEWDGRTTSGSSAAPGVYWLEVRVAGESFRRPLVRLAAGAP